MTVPPEPGAAPVGVLLTGTSTFELPEAEGLVAADAMAPRGAGAPPPPPMTPNVASRPTAVAMVPSAPLVNFQPAPTRSSLPGLAGAACALGWRASGAA